MRGSRSIPKLFSATCQGDRFSNSVINIHLYKDEQGFAKETSIDSNRADAAVTRHPK
jgi:hypothetical protein